MPQVDNAEIAHLISTVTGDNLAVSSLSENSALLGAIPELDSIAIINLIMALEQRFGFQVHDDEVEESIFTTLGSLKNFTQRKLDHLQSRNNQVSNKINE